MHEIRDKKLRFETIIREGNLFFIREEYEAAAKNYERAAQKSSKQSLDRILIYKAYRLAIHSWISACMSEKAYELINILPQELRIGTLSEITPRILAMIDYLVKKKNIN